MALAWKQKDKSNWEAVNKEGWRIIVRSFGAGDNLVFGAHNAHGSYSCYLGSEKTLEKAKKLAESGERKGQDAQPITMAEVEEPKPSRPVKPPKLVKKPLQGRGSYLSKMFGGKVWMLNRKTGKRVRIDPSEVATYAAKGFIKGGPRSK